MMRGSPRKRWWLLCLALSLFWVPAGQSIAQDNYSTLLVAGRLTFLQGTRLPETILLEGVGRPVMPEFPMPYIGYALALAGAGHVGNLNITATILLPIEFTSRLVQLAFVPLSALVVLGDPNTAVVAGHCLAQRHGRGDEFRLLCFREEPMRLITSGGLKLGAVADLVLRLQ